ncbi:hypothetical protein A176_007006 [Myxococcus hansupus]|uniref:Lipoprotein n=1 Tax=Pseudomyxococcus hansupus TaxID=1297742 RepID=A0A0H4X4G3_9BACT|nr:hypothetical protein [Myxococcus hansupus]AKQ70094.1 hypothetical protein A176_007006 [Myxococcus hansupus]
MKRQIKKALFVLLALVAAPAFAGEHHYGNGPTRESACDAAERRAERRAARLKTCYEACNVNNCKKLDDGSFTCESISSNHQGSCRR